VATVSRRQTGSHRGGAQVSERNYVRVYWGALLAYLGLTVCIGFGDALRTEALSPAREWLYRSMGGLGALAVMVGVAYCVIRLVADHRERSAGGAA